MNGLESRTVGISRNHGPSKTLFSRYSLKCRVSNTIGVPENAVAAEFCIFHFHWSAFDPYSRRGKDRMFLRETEVLKTVTTHSKAFVFLWKQIKSSNYDFRDGPRITTKSGISHLCVHRGRTQDSFFKVIHSLFLDKLVLIRHVVFQSFIWL